LTNSVIAIYQFYPIFSIKSGKIVGSGKRQLLSFLAVLVSRDKVPSTFCVNGLAVMDLSLLTSGCLPTLEKCEISRKPTFPLFPGMRVSEEPSHYVLVKNSSVPCHSRVCGWTKKGVTVTKDEEIIKTFEVVKKSGELVLEHYKARGFKNTLIEVGIKNIIGICDMALEQIAKEKSGGQEGGGLCDTTT
jgi:hypothetical protein